MCDGKGSQVRRVLERRGEESQKAPKKAQQQEQHTVTCGVEAGPAACGLTRARLLGRAAAAVAPALRARAAVRPRVPHEAARLPQQQRVRRHRLRRAHAFTCIFAFAIEITMHHFSPFPAI